MEKIMQELETLRKKENYFKIVVRNDEQIDNSEIMDYVALTNKALCDVINKATEISKESTKETKEFNKAFDKLLSKNKEYIEINKKLYNSINLKSVLIGMVLSAFMFLLSSFLRLI